MLGETRKITASERFCWALSEAAGFFGKVKTTVASRVNGDGFRTALKSVLGAFGKKQKMVFLEVPEDQLCEAWRGVSTKCSSGFYVIPDLHTSVLLYQDGKAIDLPNGTGGALYPFSANPRKKTPFWKRKAASVAEVVCVRDHADLGVFWGTPSRDHIVITDENTQKSWRVLANGQLQLKITDAKLLYETLLRAGKKTADDLKYFLRDIFIKNTKAELNDVLENIKAPSENGRFVSLSFMMELGEKYYAATKNLFRRFGLEMDESTKYTIFMSVKPELIEPEAESESQSELAESALKELLW